MVDQELLNKMVVAANLKISLTMIEILMGDFKEAVVGLEQTSEHQSWTRRCDIIGAHLEYFLKDISAEFEALRRELNEAKSNT